MIDHKKICRVISRRRQHLGLTQHALAKRCGMSRQLICKVENGYSPDFGIMKLERIAKGLELDIYEFVRKLDENSGPFIDP